MIKNEEITGLILAGGRGTRMGGVDKGLQPFKGMPLALHTLLRLEQQVGHVLINANQNLSAYESFGVPVVLDATADFSGPLAGFAAGLAQCETEYMLTVPCDTPLFPTNLVPRLAAALEQHQADCAMVKTADGFAQPVFCLLKAHTLSSLTAFIHAGGRKIDKWTASLNTVMVEFDNIAAFSNANTRAELSELEKN